MMTKAELIEYIAQAWCTHQNDKKVMDGELVMDIADILWPHIEYIQRPQQCLCCLLTLCMHAKVHKEGISKTHQARIEKLEAVREAANNYIEKWDKGHHIHDKMALLKQALAALEDK